MIDNNNMHYTIDNKLKWINQRLCFPHNPKDDHMTASVVHALPPRATDRRLT